MTEYAHVERPFLDHLAQLGWTVIDQGSGVPSDPAASLRGSFREWLLPGVFREAVRAINLTAGGQPWLTDTQLDDLRDQILRQPNRTLLEASEAVQALLFKAQVARNEVTGEVDPVVHLIDFRQPERNQFHAINQFRIDTPGCVKHCIIPDLVLFVNGIPVVVVEAKIGGPTCANPLYEAFVQLQRYRNARPATAAASLREGEPRLFHPVLLLVRTCGEQADYGTITSREEHFAPWKCEPGIAELHSAGSMPSATRRSQEELIHGMLRRAVLLDLLRTCTVFMDTDSGTRVKVTARYQQYRAACKIRDRLRQGSTAEERSGVIWHTQGSGKSLTMVFVARMMRTSHDLYDWKLVLVNDRSDLEDQLADTAALIGGKVKVISSTTDLRTHLGSDISDVCLVMVHKFQDRPEELPARVAEALADYRAVPSGGTFGVVNASPRILLMVDEAHRTQGSDLGNNLFEAFPEATRIAFTGTPLITERHGGKRTVKRFGEYIDQYKLLDAVHDGATVQILYEGKTADTALNEKAEFDRKFEDLFGDRSEAELLAIKKKYGATGDILEAENRIQAIARDLVDHYIDHVLPNGFKAQVVCHSKLAAVRYCRFIRAALAERLEQERLQAKPDTVLIARIAFLKAAVVVSADATNEPAIITQARKESQAWNAVDQFCAAFDRADPDKVHTGIAFLVVCDMLLTGFDAPVEQVMYIDKRLTEHNLLQAIARVNRTASGKKRGYIVDYIGLTSHLTEALRIYTTEGEQQELEGFKQITSEVPVLDDRFNRLVQIFEAAGIARIKAFATGAAMPAADEIAIVHAAVGALKDLRLRADFEVFLKQFLASLDIVLPHPAAHPFRVPARRFGYLLRMAKERYKDDSIQLGDAGEKVRQLINEHLISLGIDPKVPPIELFADDFLAKVAAHAQGNPEAKASEMEHAIRRHCTIHLDEDPAFYKHLSEKLERVLERHRQNWDELGEKLTSLRHEALAGRREPVAGLDREASTFYEHLARLAFGQIEPPAEHREAMKAVIRQLIELLQGTIGIIDFWNKAGEQKRLRGLLTDTLLFSGIQPIIDQRERLAVEVLKLAKNRHEELLK